MAGASDGREPLEAAARPLFDSLREALESATPAELKRLGRAKTSIAFHVDRKADHDVTLTLQCDDGDPTVARGAQPAEVNVRMSSEQAEQMSRGEFNLPVMLIEGELTCSGPVRKFLTVEPILRGLIRQESQGDARD
jgi:hypothetical protein